MFFFFEFKRRIRIVKAYAYALTQLQIRPGSGRRNHNSAIGIELHYALLSMAFVEKTQKITFLPYRISKDIIVPTDILPTQVLSVHIWWVLK